MYYLRLARGFRTLDLSRWLLAGTASAVVAAFLLRALGRALGDPTASSAAARLFWCLPPLAAVAWLSALMAQAVPAERPERIAGLTAAGAGPLRIRALIGAEIALACAFGSAASLLLFLILRNDIAGPGLASDLGMGIPLPIAAPVTLLALVPLAAGVCAAASVDLTDTLPGRAQQAAGGLFHPLRLAVPSGVLLVGIGLELYGLRPGAAQDGRPIMLPAALGSTRAASLTGWILAALALLLLTGPLLSVAGRLLAFHRATPLRLLAGRGLTAQAGRLGIPLGVLGLTLAVVLTAARHWSNGHGPAGPLSAVEAILLSGCATAAVAARLVEVRAAHRPTTDALHRLGTPPALISGAAILRSCAIGVVLLLTGGLTALLLDGILG